MATDSEVLAVYESARDEVLTNGYSVSVDGREWRRDNLAALERMIDKYRIRVNQTTRGSILDNARFGAPYRGA